MRVKQYQENILKSMKFNNNVIVNSCRQSGKSMTCILYICDIIENEQRDLNICLVVPSQTILNSQYTELVHELRHVDCTVIQKNQSELIIGDIYDHEKRIVITTPDDKCKSYTNFDVLIFDDMAHCNDTNLTSFLTLITPLLTPDSKKLLISTDKKNTVFHDIWIGTSDYVKIVVNWWDVSGNDEEWYEIMKSKLGDKFDAEYVIK